MSRVIVTNELCDLIHSIRIENHKKTTDLAKYIGKSAGYISRLEHYDINTIDDIVLTQIFKYITNNDSSFNDVISEIYDKLSVKYTKEEIEKQVWFTNFDTVIRRVPVTESYVEYVKALLGENKISISYLARRINANESLSLAEIQKYKKTPNRWWNSGDSISPSLSIYVQISEELILEILEKKMQVSSYIFLFAIVLYSLKIAQYGEIIDIGDPEYSMLYDKTSEVLLDNNIYTLLERGHILNISEGKNSILSIVDKKNLELRKRLFEKFEWLSDMDVQFANRYFKDYLENLEWDMGFTFAISSLKLNRLKTLPHETKKELLNKIRALVDDYCNSENSQLFEKY